MQLRRRQAVLAIAVGGLVAGTLDLAQACILFDPKIPWPLLEVSLGLKPFVAAQPSISWVSSCTS
jgi:hypothetical protein